MRFWTWCRRRTCPKKSAVSREGDAGVDAAGGTVVEVAGVGAETAGVVFEEEAKGEEEEEEGAEVTAAGEEGGPEGAERARVQEVVETAGEGVGKGQELQSVDLPASRLPSPLNPSIPCAARLTVRPSAHADAGGAAERSMYAYVRYVVKVKRSKRGYVYAAKYGPRAVTEMGVPLLSTFSSRVSAGRWGVRGVGGATERALCRRAPGTLRSVGD